MNIPVLIVASFTFLAVVAHIFGGTKDSASLIPDKNNETLTRNWKQSMCAFQMLAVDLLLITILLFIISLTNLITFKYELTLFLSLLYFMWGIVWLIQLFWIKSNVKTFFILPQWIFWFVGSALLYYGA